MEIVSRPDREFTDRRNDTLWLLTDVRGEFQDQATAYFLGHDRDAEGDDLAGQRLRELAKEHGLDLDEAEKTLADYRSLLGQRLSAAAAHPFHEQLMVLSLALVACPLAVVVVVLLALATWRRRAPSLINCPGCGGGVSLHATECPHCGHSVKG